MRSINYLWAIPTILIIFISYLLRALRWKVIIDALHPINFGDAYHPLIIGFMVNCILPGRVGEIVRPLYLKNIKKVPFPSGLAAVAAERVFDMLFLLTAFAVMLSFINVDTLPDKIVNHAGIGKDALLTAINGTAKLCLLTLAVLALVLYRNSRIFIQKVLLSAPACLVFIKPKTREMLREKILRPITRMMESFSSGLSLFQSSGRILACLSLSLIIWSLQAMSFYVFSFGCPGIGLTYFQMFAVMILICFFIALPSVPGYWGIWEAGGIFALSLFGILSEDAAGFTLANHALQIIPVILLGGVSLLLTGMRASLSPGRANYPHHPKPSAPQD